MNIFATWSATTLMLFFRLCLLRFMKTRRAIGTGMFGNRFVDDLVKIDVCRTIHGMVYNAMKLFMEVNPQLFDECSHQYAEQQNGEGQRQRDRQARWDRLAQIAQSKQNGRIPIADGTGSRPNATLPALNESDSQESQRRLEQLRLRDDEAVDGSMSRRRGDRGVRGQRPSDIRKSL
jgi:hypothetical protein